MIELHLDARTLGNTVFGFSPLSEIASSLKVLADPEGAGVHRPWLTDVHGRLDDLPLSMLAAVSGEGKWAPDFLYPTVSSPRVTLEDQLHGVARLTSDDMDSELSTYWPRGSQPASLTDLLERGSDAGKHLAAALDAYWSRALAPYWVRMFNVLEEDVGYRASQSMSMGLFGLFEELHPRVAVDGDALTFDMPGHPPQAYADATLTLVPSVFLWPGLVITHETTGRFQITYGARGTARAWEGLANATREGQPLSALVGRTRAAILQRLLTPHSTTQLARELNQSPAAVSQHLRVLRESGLATSWRTGRVVLYQQTPLASSLVEMNQVDPSA
jgi:biotin operon repressor